MGDQRPIIAHDLQFKNAVVRGVLASTNFTLKVKYFKQFLVESCKINRKEDLDLSLKSFIQASLMGRCDK